MIRLVAYLWVGMILGVSFLATPVKFRAESLTLPVALDVGRATFHAFGKVEWALAVLLAVAMARLERVGALGAGGWLLFAVVVAIVALQALWLIPRLDVRVEAIMSGQDPAASHLHLIFIGVELIKALMLLVIGFSVDGRPGV